MDRNHRTSELIEVMSQVMRFLDEINIEISSSETDAIWTLGKMREFIQYGQAYQERIGQPPILEMELEDIEMNLKIRLKMAYEVESINEET